MSVGKAAEAAEGRRVHTCAPPPASAPEFTGGSGITYGVLHMSLALCRCGYALVVEGRGRALACEATL